MHKLTKGIKKKIKGKKGKHHDDELFSAEELDKYRRDQEEAAEGKRAAAAAAALEDPEFEEAEPKEENEEWQRFKALTSGIDTVLKKTQEDLDRIKGDSYFQRKRKEEQEKVPSKEPVKRKGSGKSKKWIGFGEGQQPEEEEVESDKENQPQEAGAVVQEGDSATAGAAEAEVSTQDDLPEQLHIVEIPEEEPEQDEDIFDTSYVDVVTSGEVKFAYVPESPTEDTKDDEPDPFDTSAVDALIKSNEPEVTPGKPKKKLVDLGLAAEVLSGIVDKDQAAAITGSGSKSSKRRRVVPREVNLLLGSFDAGDGAQETEPEPKSPVEPTLETVPESILDLDVSDDLLAVESLDSTLVTAAVAAPKASDKETSSPKEAADVKEDDVGLKDLVAEFDVIDQTASDVGVESLLDETPAPAVKQERDEDDDLEDEFAALASESLQKPTESVPTADTEPVKDEQEDPFASDPFDTSVADFALGTGIEVEKEERGVEKPPEEKPVGKSEWAEFEDSSEVEPPKKSAPPRPAPARPGPPSRPPPAKSEPNAIPDEEFEPKSSLEVAKDLLSGSTTDLTQLGEAIAPVVPKEEKPKPPPDDFDPFDTSVVETTAAPGKAELRLLEEELLRSTVDKVEEDDDDFDPRAGEPPPPLPQLRPDALKVGAFDDEDALSEGIVKPLTPAAEIAQEEKKEEEELDPFDTSHVEAIAPGKAELKQLEKELSEAQAIPQVRRFSDFEFEPRKEEPAKSVPQPRPQELPVQKVLPPDLLHSPEGEAKPEFKPLTPLVENSNDKLNYVDPFDTSYAEILPRGQAELKLIESELVGTVESTSDDDFNPREGETDECLPKAPEASLTAEAILEVGDQHRVKPLTPVVERKAFQEEELDPFDTSIANNILPGKSELKVLEDELLQSTIPDVITVPSIPIVIPATVPTAIPAVIKKSLSDEDFDPRGEVKAEEGQPKAAPFRPAAPARPAAPIRPPPPSTLDLTETLGTKDDTVKPLTPVVGLQLEATAYEDPFDTSIADNIVPGKAELKLLADELVNGEETSLKRSVTDPDFNPRTDEPPEEGEPQDTDQHHLLESKDPHKVKPLTPQVERKVFEIGGGELEEEEADPFDTSIVDKVAQPGKAEIRVLESQLLN